MLWLSSASVTLQRMMLLDRKCPHFLGVMVPPSYARESAVDPRTDKEPMLVACLRL